MFGRTLVAVLAVVVIIAAIAGAGTYVYNAGIAEGVAEAARQAAASGDAAPVVVYPGYGYGWGHGPGFGWGLGIIFWILGFFLLFGLLRAAFGWGRWGGNGHGRRGRWEEIHREMHERERTDATG